MNISPNLFLFAHQDDEFGVFWEIHRLVAAGGKVAVVYLTSGDTSGLPAPVRDLESLSVLARLGVPKEDIYFLGRDAGIPDGCLADHMETAYERALNLIEAIGKPKRLYVLAWEGGHQDHDAVHLVGTSLAKHFGILDQCHQFPLYTGAGLPSFLFKLFSPLPENGTVQSHRISWRERFSHMAYCLAYPSQKKTWLGLFPFFVFHYLFFGTQLFQLVSLQRVCVPPHAGVLLYERRVFYSYAKFSE